MLYYHRTFIVLRYRLHLLSFCLLLLIITPWSSSIGLHETSSDVWDLSVDRVPLSDWDHQHVAAMSTAFLHDWPSHRHVTTRADHHSYPSSSWIKLVCLSTDGYILSCSLLVGISSSIPPSYGGVIPTVLFNVLSLSTIGALVNVAQRNLEYSYLTWFLLALLYVYSLQHHGTWRLAVAATYVSPMSHLWVLLRHS